MIQRTNRVVEVEVLEILRFEAERQAISLARKIVEDKELRHSRRPRVGVGRSGTGVSQESVEREDLPAEQ